MIGTDPLGATALILSSMWNQALDDSAPRHRCRTAVAIDVDVTPARFAFLGICADLDPLTLRARRWLDIVDDRVIPLDESEAGRRLLELEVAALVATRGVQGTDGALRCDPGFRAAQWEARARRANTRNLLLQAGLEEVTSLRGADPRTIAALEAAWSTEQAVTIDVATELAQGAARQRYVDPSHPRRSSIRLRGLERLLAGRGVRSNRLLAI